MLETSLLMLAVGSVAALLLLNSIAESKRGCSSMLDFYANLLADVRVNRETEEILESTAVDEDPPTSAINS